jgi:hypothetical protein
LVPYEKLGFIRNDKKNLKLTSSFLVIVNVASTFFCIVTSLVSDLGLQYNKTIVFCDSQSTIHLTTHENITLKKIPIAENQMNMLIKLVSISKFKYCLDLIGVCSLYLSLKMLGEMI